jgi:hypothetical protein
MASSTRACATPGISTLIAGLCQLDADLLSAAVLGHPAAAACTLETEIAKRLSHKNTALRRVTSRLLSLPRTCCDPQGRGHASDGRHSQAPGGENYEILVQSTRSLQRNQSRTRDSKRQNSRPSVCAVVAASCFSRAISSSDAVSVDEVSHVGYVCVARAVFTMNR